MITTKYNKTEDPRMKLTEYCIIQWAMMSSNDQSNFVQSNHVRLHDTVATNSS